MQFLFFWLILFAMATPLASSKIGLFLFEFGCHGNTLRSIKILDSIYEFAYLENLVIRKKKSSFLRTTKISAILAIFAHMWLP